MTEKKRSRRRKDEYTGPGGVQREIDKPNKEEYLIAKWLKKNIRTKKTKFLNHNVEYFTSSKALDALMKSHFAEGDNCLFPTRENAIEYLDLMLEHKFFHRARKVPVYLEDMKNKAKKGEKGETTASKKEKDEKEIEGEKEKLTDQDSHVEGTVEEMSAKEKRKRKIRLEMHPEQLFVDGSEAYVWIYDPVPIYYWIYGTILVLGAIVICLFPLWPPILRKGVYYLSIAAAGFLVFIFALTILRLIIFVILWLVSRGKLYFWIFPNLTEDVGFFASFWPLYEYEYRVKGEKTKTNKKLKKKKKEKDSDNEDEKNEADSYPTESVKNTERDTAPSGVETIDDQAKESLDGSPENKENPTFSESESEGSRSSTGKDFEMVDAKEVDTS